jgi:hypothetical protein
MLPVSLDCFSSSCVFYAASFFGIQRNWQHRIHKTKKNNPEKLAT